MKSNALKRYMLVSAEAREQRIEAIRNARAQIESSMRDALGDLACAEHGAAARAVAFKYADPEDLRGSVECRPCCERMKAAVAAAIRRALAPAIVH